MHLPAGPNPHTPRPQGPPPLPQVPAAPPPAHVPAPPPGARVPGPPPPAMPPPPDAAQPPPPQRKGQWPFILALLLVLPIAVGVPWWLERQESLAAGSMPPPAPTVDTGAAELAGSTWDYRGAAVGEVGEATPPPEGVELVDAVFDITPGDEAAAMRLAERCRIQAEDADGRTWDTTVGYDTRDALDGPDLADASFGGCTDPETFEALPPGETARAVVSFLVPEDAVASLSFVISTNSNYVEPDEDSDLSEWGEEDLQWDPDSGYEPPQPVAVTFPAEIQG